MSSNDNYVFTSSDMKDMLALLWEMLLGILKYVVLAALVALCVIAVAYALS